jgi:hypothetical protein
MSMIYKLIGMFVVKGGRLFLRRRYGPTMTPKPVLAGAVAAGVVGVALVATKSNSN